VIFHPHGRKQNQCSMNRQERTSTLRKPSPENARGEGKSACCSGRADKHYKRPIACKVCRTASSSGVCGSAPSRATSFLWPSRSGACGAIF